MYHWGVLIMCRKDISIALREVSKLKIFLESQSKRKNIIDSKEWSSVRLQIYTTNNFLKVHLSYILLNILITYVYVSSKLILNLTQFSNQMDLKPKKEDYSILQVEKPFEDSFRWQACLPIKASQDNWGRSGVHMLASSSTLASSHLEVSWPLLFDPI